MNTRPYKIPRSVLVVIYTPALDVLLIERADKAGFWQSVTGSLDAEDELLAETAQREVREETGIDVAAHGGTLQDWQQTNTYEIFARWAHRYAPGVTHNTEHVFGLLVPPNTPVKLSPREHTAYQWAPWQQAAQLCFSPSNAQAILQLPKRQPVQ
jgi:dihydroneopterin triphosphate diphosphatase